MRWRLALSAALPLLAVACAEMRQAPPPPPPTDLLAGSQQPGALVNPVRGAVLASAAAFADAGLSLADKPEATAQAAAQLEYLVIALPVSRGYAGINETTRINLGLARDEVRSALGIAAEAPGDAVMRALLAAARAQRAGQGATAAAALPAGMFRPGGVGSIRRLAEPGPLPMAAMATSQAQQEVARLETSLQWAQEQAQDGGLLETGPPGGIGPGLGGRF